MSYSRAPQVPSGSSPEEQGPHGHVAIGGKDIVSTSAPVTLHTGTEGVILGSRCEKCRLEHYPEGRCKRPLGLPQCDSKDSLISPAGMLVCG